MAIRGTTPDYILEIEDVDLSGQTVYVTIAQGNRKITKTGDTLDIVVAEGGSTISFRLSQEETLGLNEGDASVQVKFIDATGTAEGTDIGTIKINKALLEKVIDYVADD